MNKASHAPTIAERLGSDFESIDFDVSNGTLKADYLPGEINVDASRMSSADYKAMEKEISEARVDTATFSVYAWNDVSGHKYWKKQGGEGDFNYIQVTVVIRSQSADVGAITTACDDMQTALSKWDNI